MPTKFLIKKKKEVFNYYMRLRGLELADVAARSGYEQQTLYNMLSSGAITRKAADTLSRILICRPEELIEGEFSQETMDARKEKRRKKEEEVVSDEKAWMRTMLLTQARTIENLSFLAKMALHEGKDPE